LATRAHAILSLLAASTSATALLAGWSITTPPSNSGYSRSVDVSALGTAPAATLSCTCMMKDKNGVVRSNFSTTSGSTSPFPWMGTLLKPGGGWDTNLNPYSCEVWEAGSTQPDATNTNINFN